MPNDRPAIVLVVAAAENGIIGRDGAMPWHIPADLKRFRRMTVGKPVVMGRRTFDSIGRPLPGRHNIVLTRQPGWSHPGVTVAATLADAIAAAGLDPRARAGEIMVIGGAQIYAETMPIATRIELTRVHLTPEGDARFDDPDPAEWLLVAEEAQPAEGDAPACTYQSFVRRELAPPPSSR